MLTVFSGSDGYPISNDDYYIRELASGYNEVVFQVSIRDPIYEYIREEAVVRDRDQNVYLIKQIDAGEKTAKVVAQINLDDWKKDLFIDYSNNSATVAGTIGSVLPAGWSLIDHSGIAKRRTIPTGDNTSDYNVTALQVLEACTTVYEVRFQFNTSDRIVTIVNPKSYSVKGAFATRDLNLVKLNYKGKSDSFVTRLYAEGADGLTFASINDGKPYVENLTYANKVVSAYWKDDRYTDAQSLLEDAQAKVDEMAMPSQSYDCEVLDLANTNPELYGFEDFSLFEVVTLIDDAKETRSDYQVVERWTYPYYPAKNKVVLSSSTPNIQTAIATIVNSLSSSTSSFQQIWQSAINNATSLITGNSGGFLVLRDSNGDGTPDELLIMDTNSIETATKVWRWNQAGLGYSKTGYNGPYNLGITMGGEIVASFVTAGVMNADVIRAGTLTDDNGDNYWNLETGEFRLSSTTTVGGKTISELVEGKAETWYQASDPSLAWTTAEDKASHKGDLWYRTTDDTTWYYDYSGGTYIWRQQNVPNIVFDKIDGKAQVFVSQPTPPYNVGDLWCQNDSDIMTCVTARTDSESYAASDWAKKNNYTDQQDITNSISTYDTSLNQLAVFNKLTNNGATQGIYLESGDLYINGTYIKAGTIDAGALSVSAQEAFNITHDYVPFDYLSNLTRYTQRAAFNPLSFVTLDSKVYLAIDGTGHSTVTTSDYATLHSDFLGSPTMSIKFKLRFSAQYTCAVDQRFFGISYDDDTGTGRVTYRRWTSATTFEAGQDYEYEFTMTPPYIAVSDQRIRFYYQPDVIMYVTDLEITSSQAVYNTAALSVTPDGLSSVVQSGDIISTINQSAETVSIKAAKIDLTGALSLHGDFTTYDPNNNDNKVYLNAGNLEFWVGDGQGSSDIEFVIATDYYSDKTGILFGNPDDPLTVNYTMISKDSVKSGLLLGYYSGDSPSPSNNTTFLNEGEAHFYGGIVSHSTVDMYGTEFVNLISNPTKFEATVYNSSGGSVFVSDKRKKKNIADLVIDKARSFLMALRPRSFKFKDGTSNRKHHGFIAQEVKSAMSEDWGLYIEDKEQDFIGLRYDELIADMVSVIQDQERRIEALERRVDDLTGIQS